MEYYFEGFFFSFPQGQISATLWVQHCAEKQNLTSDA